MMKEKKEKNAIELLKDITAGLVWYDGVMEQRRAATLKTNLHLGKVSYRYACNLLAKLGYKKVKEEVWSR